MARLIAANFPKTRYLSADGASRLLARMAAEAIAGGSAYDALVGAAAAEHRLVLATRDRRAVDVYRALAVQVELVA